jgi:hypothetical protein
VKLDADTTVGATFKQKTFTLSVTFMGSGSVTDTGIANVNCSGDCQTQVAAGTMVTLQAAGSTTPRTRFNVWGGDCSGASCAITMDGDKSVTASFVNQHKLTVIVDHGLCTTNLHQITSTPPGIDCGFMTGTCEAYFDEFSAPLLTVHDDTANPPNQPGCSAYSSGFSYSGCAMAFTACTIYMNMDQTVTAHFTVPIT